MKVGQISIIRKQEIISNPNGEPGIKTSQGIEISQEAVTAGFLTNFTGEMLSVYLYLLTHVKEDLTLTVTIDTIRDLLARNSLEIKTALTMLEAADYIGIVKDEDWTVIKISLKQTLTASVPKTPQLNQRDTVENNAVKRNDPLLEYIFRQKTFSEKDLVRAISSMIPAQSLTQNFRQEIEYWFKTFEKDVIKELIRRTDETWQRDPDLNCQAYMRKIANEWIADQIFTTNALEKSDKIYRQIQTLLKEFGIDRQKEMTRTHWQTIYNWINHRSPKDFALSLPVAKFAIQEAIRRKSDGRPSMTYIEDNFIKPFKANKVKSIEEARTILNQKPTLKTPDKNSSPKNSSPKNKWQLGIDFTRFREN